MRLTVIGSGDAFCSGGALHSCYLLEHAGGRLMLECGPGVLTGMKRLGLDTGLPDAVLVSHLHGDHFGGLPFLLLEYRYANPRDRPLIVAGPEGTGERVMEVYDALYRGICREEDFDLEFREYGPDCDFELAGMKIHSFAVPHNAQPYSLGYRVESSEGVLLFSGDSAWTDDFAANSQGADLFLCECCSMQGGIPVHLSYSELLARRDALGCPLLLTHLGVDVRGAGELELERAHDGLVVDFPPK